ncbi:hypothetical protein FGE12_09635 [Aggregicoccus sp. 17bor-14]|uniref:alpha/beta hydrolase family protein n=1 Tax=Myxococcaceae TaxID=31 RepID=UPI00129CF03F|nr:MULTISPECIES: hypothetical protein [Myxococcaceae]MBF5042661.1 hypothetical protein [Simulacricoccus sp. 17bor-14]MRI88429.1 hypothetical protein [Aggregicoccus sp. 17bor-14]
MRRFCLVVVLLAGCAHPRAPAPAIRELSGTPPGGLAYRLYLPEGPRPARLVLWLHPSGHSLNETAARLAPLLARHGFALLTPVDKDFHSWRSDEANRLMGVTLPSLAQQPGLEARRPVLLGFSAGGQLALLLWQGHPELLGGAVLMATSPVDARGDAIAAPEASPAVLARAPLLVLTGERDVGAGPWRAAEGRLRRAGAVLQVRTVPERGHEWLLEGAQLDALERWLAALPSP